MSLKTNWKLRLMIIYECFPSVEILNPSYLVNHYILTKITRKIRTNTTKIRLFLMGKKKKRNGRNEMNTINNNTKPLLNPNGIKSFSPFSRNILSWEQVTIKELILRILGKFQIRVYIPPNILAKKYLILFQNNWGYLTSSRSKILI